MSEYLKQSTVEKLMQVSFRLFSICFPECSCKLYSFDLMLQSYLCWLFFFLSSRAFSYLMQAISV